MLEVADMMRPAVVIRRRCIRVPGWVMDSVENVFSPRLDDFSRSLERKAARWGVAIITTALEIHHKGGDDTYTLEARFKMRVSGRVFWIQVPLGVLFVATRDGMAQMKRSFISGAMLRIAQHKLGKGA